MRKLIEAIDRQLDSIDERQRRLMAEVSEDSLFWSPTKTTDTMLTMSVGGSVLRSAAMVEQAFLGLTRRLWDDPFEWTLPEKLSTRAAITEYLDEVAETRRDGLKFLASDGDLARELPAPEKMRSVLDVLVGAIARAENYLGRGEAIGQLRNEDWDWEKSVRAPHS